MRNGRTVAHAHLNVKFSFGSLLKIIAHFCSEPLLLRSQLVILFRVCRFLCVDISFTSRWRRGEAALSVGHRLGEEEDDEAP